MVRRAMEHRVWARQEDMTEGDQRGGPVWHGTTVLCVRKEGAVVVAGDGQVTLGQTVIKANARKVRRLQARARISARPALDRARGIPTWCGARWSTGYGRGRRT